MYIGGGGFSLSFGDGFSLNAVLNAEGVHNQGSRPGWVLVAVALLQVLSYPAHDPVMMDRGFIAGRKRTNYSFIIAFIISSTPCEEIYLNGYHASFVRKDLGFIATNFIVEIRTISSNHHHHHG